MSLQIHLRLCLRHLLFHFSTATLIIQVSFFYYRMANWSTYYRRNWGCIRRPCRTVIRFNSSLSIIDALCRGGQGQLSATSRMGFIMALLCHSRVLLEWFFTHGNVMASRQHLDPSYRCRRCKWLGSISLMCLYHMRYATVYIMIATVYIMIATLFILAFF